MTDAHDEDERAEQAPDDEQAGGSDAYADADRAEGGVATDGPRSEQESEEEAKEIIEKTQADPPSDPRDWPGGRAKYMTVGDDTSDRTWEEGPEANLGPADLRRHQDGSVTVKGEQVDDPDQYKGDPIPGGPTDPDAADTGPADPDQPA